MKRYAQLALVAALSIVATTRVSQTLAANYTWTNTSGGNWNSSANWSSNTNVAPGYPGANDSANIPGVLTGPVVVNFAAYAKTLSVGNTGTVVDISAGESLSIESGVTNNGTISVLANSSNGTLFFSGTQTLSGSGSVVLSSSGANPAYLEVAGLLTQAAGHTISGAGQFLYGSFINQGLVNANVPGQTLSGNNVSGVTNSAVMEATNGGTLLLNYPVVNSSTVLASGGTVQVGGGGGISGGTLTNNTGASGLQLLNSSSISGVTLSPNSTAVVPPGDGALVLGGLTNNGTIKVLSNTSSGGGILYFYTPETLSGSGSIVLGPYSNPNNAPLLQMVDTLTQAAGHTISGAGELFNGALNNQGLVNANMSGQTLSTVNVDSITNSGLMEATNGGILLLNCPVVNSSTVLASGGTVQVGGGGSISGGTLTNNTGASGLQLLNSSSISGVTLSPNSTAVVPPGDGALVLGGLTNNGTIKVLSNTSSGGGILYFYTPETLSGSGSIVLGPYSNPNNAPLLQMVDTLTQAAGHTISGAGELFNGALNNQGLVNANMSGQTLSTVNVDSITNSGLMEATNGGILLLNCPVVNSSTVLASGGTVQVGGGGGISGGTLTNNTGASGLQLLNSSSISGVTLSPNSTAVVPPGDGALVLGGLTNNGTIKVLSNTSSGGGILYFYTPETLSGSGSIVLGPYSNPNNAPLLQMVDTLTQAAGHTISGAGELFNGALNNQGLVNANMSGQTLSTVNVDSITNSGLMEATNGGILLLNCPVVNSSTVLASGGTVQVESTFTGGTLTSTGTSSLSSSGGTLSGVTLSAGSEFNIPSGGTPTITNGIINNGTITVDSPSGGTASSLVFSGSQTASGSGSIVLAYSSALLNTSNSGVLTQAAGHTISGAGTLSAALNNRGLVNANVNGQTLYLATNPMTNTGTMEATSGGELEINGIAVKNSGGTIQAVGGSVQISSGTIAGGTLASAGTSSLNAGGVILIGVAVAPGSQLNTYGGVTVTVTSGLTNNGTITVDFNGLTHVSSLTFSGSQTLSGNGSVVLNYYPFAQLNTSNSGVLTQAAGSTITGSGFIIAALNNLGTVESNGYINVEGPVTQVSGSTLNGGTWIAEANSTLSITSAGTLSTNQGTVILDGPNSLFSNVSPLTVNQGSFTVRDGGAFTTAGPLSNSGTVAVGAASTLTVSGVYSPLPGSVTIADGSLAFSGTMNERGLLEGSGTAQGSVSLAAGGSIAPGRIGTVGTLSIGGNLVLGGNSTLDFDLGASSSLLAIAGSLTVSGTSALSFTQTGPLAAGYTLATYQQTNAAASNFTLAGATGGYRLQVLPSEMILGADTWQFANSGSWNDGTKWSFGSPPSGAGITAVVGAATTKPWMITLDGQQTLGALILANSASNTAGYTLTKGNSGSIVLNNLDTGAEVVVTGGSHTIFASVTLNDNLTVTSTAGTTLTVSGNIGQSGTTESLTLDGAGVLVLSGTNTYSGGTTVEGGTLIAMNNQAIGDGTNLSVGTELSLFGTALLAQASSVAAIPAVASVPEPSPLALLATAGTFLLLRRRRR